MLVKDAQIDFEVLNETTSEYDIASLIDEAIQKPSKRHRVLELLYLGHPVYLGRGEAQINRIRGYLLSACETIGLPDDYLIYALDELENSQNAYLVGASAKALRGVKDYDMKLVPYLLSAITNIQYRDDALDFSSYATSWPVLHYTTAIQEILTTLKQLGKHAAGAVPILKSMSESQVYNRQIRKLAKGTLEEIVQKIETDDKPCCGSLTITGQMPALGKAQIEFSEISDIEIQNQSAKKTSFGHAFLGRPTIVGFFYTRCGNPNKCSLTVTKLGLIQALIAENESLRCQINVAGITYDPGYDTPDKLEGYFNNRGFSFDEFNNAWRSSPEKIGNIQDFFSLGVAYAGSLVTQHQIELYILDKNGKLRQSYTNLQWTPADIVQEVCNLLEE